MSKLTQIALDFGQEPQAPPPEPAAAPAVNDGEGEAPVRPYMTAGGVGVRIKAYKQVPTPQNGDLFGSTAPEEAPASSGETGLNGTFAAVAADPAIAEEPAVAAKPIIMAEQPPATEPVLAEEPEPAAAAEPTPVIALEEQPKPAPALTPSAADAAPAAPRAAAQATPAAKRGPAAKRPAAAKPAPSKRGRKSLKQVAAEADLIEIPEDEILFSKQYYTMGEVSEMFHVNQSLLRFWETEFDILQPRKNKKGDRYFRPVDIKHLHLIYHLLRQKKYTIEGAKEFLKNNKKAEERFEIIQRLQQIKAFLQEMKAQL